VNVWHSHRAETRDPARAGLDWVALECDDPAALDGLKARLDDAGVPVESFAGGFVASDPWGTRIRFAPAV
jgi:catechol-2,3-dioxygenase